MKLPARDDWEKEKEYLSVLEIAKELELVDQTLQGQVDRVGVEYFNVADYPASTVQASVQAAIDAASAAGGGIVFFPRGDYGFTGSVSVASGVWLTGEGYASRIYVAEAFADNVIKFENVSNSGASLLRIDGNRDNVTGSQYGFFFGSCVDCCIYRVWAHDLRGDGIHFYDCDGCQQALCHSSENIFHGLEIEQCRDFQSIGGTFHDNDVNGIYIFEGEVSASGSHGVTVVGAVCNDNGDYGVAVQGPLSDDISVTGCVFRGNGSYGATIFDRTQGVKLNDNVVSLNGDHGIYLWRVQGAQVHGNRLHNNSQNANASFQEIMLDGDATQYSKYNSLIGNTILINGTNKAAHGIKENSINDSDNIIQQNIILGSPVVAAIAPVSEASIKLCKNNIGRVDENHGTETQNADGSTTIFFWAHGLTTDEPRTAYAVPGSMPAGAQHFVSWDNTNIYVEFAVAPANDSGTGSIVFHWGASH